MTISLDRGTITIGSSAQPSVVASSIQVKGERHRYTISGVAGQRVYFDSQTRTEVALTLTAPNGRSLLNNYNLRWNVDTFFTLPDSGTYTLEVDGLGEATGSYRFSFIGMNQAEMLELTEQPTRRATLEPGSATHLYQFTGVEGQRIYLDAKGQSTQGQFILFGPAAQMVPDIATATTGNLSGDREFVLPATGTYLLSLQGDGTASVPYEFQVLLPQTLRETLTFTSQSPTIEQRRSITGKGERHVYTFSGMRGQQFHLDTFSRTNVQLVLSGSDGSRYINSTLQSLDQNEKTFTLFENGTYQLEIDGIGETTGEYRFKLAAISQMTSLSLNAPITANLQQFEDRAYRLDGQAGQRLRLTSLTPNSNAFWKLLSPSGEVLINFSSANQLLEVTLPTSGTYTLVTHLNRASAGESFTFQVSDVTTTGSIITPSGFGVVYSGTGRANQTIVANAGTLIYFDSQVPYNRFAPPIELRDAANRVIQIWNSSEDSQPAQGRFSYLPQTGTYTLNFLGDGSYRYQVLNLSQATPLPSTQTHSVTLNPNTTTIYQFTGTLGDQLFWDTLSISRARVRIVAASGHELLSGPVDYYDYDRLKLNESGTYYIILENTDASPTEVRFQLLQKSQATAIEMGRPISGNFSANTPTLAFRFNGQANQTIYVDLLKDQNWRLYRPNGEPVALAYGWGGDAQGDAKIQLPDTGEYFLLLRNPYYASPTASYQIALSQPPIRPFTEGSTEFLIDQVVNQRIASLGEEHQYTFSGKIGQQIYFDPIGTAEAEVVIYSPTGRIIYANQFANEDSRNLLVLEEAGSYRIAIQGKLDFVGDYKFQVLTKQSSAEILMNTAIAEVDTRLIDPQASAVYRFRAEAGQHIYIDQQGPFSGSSWSSNNWQVFTPSGQPIVGNLFGYDWEGVLPVSGEYLLVMRGIGVTANDSTKYKIRLTQPPFISAPLDLNTMLTAPQSGRIAEVGERDFYTFSGTVGQQLYLDTLTQQSSYGVEITIISPSGKVVYGSREIATEDTKNLFTLSEAGTYTVMIDGRYETTGNYSFRLIDVQDVEQLEIDAAIAEIGQIGSSYHTTLYRFTAQKGRLLFVDQQGTVSRDSWGGGNVWSLYSPSGEFVPLWGAVQSQNFGYDWEFLLPDDGEYLLVMQGQGYPTLDYKIQLVDPNFTLTQITLQQTISTPISGVIESAGERDIYTFEGRIGQQIFIDALTVANQATRLIIESPSGQRIHPLNLAEPWKESLLVLQEVGTYHIFVDGFATMPRSYGAGTYSFRLLDKQDAPVLSFTTNELQAGSFAPGRQESQVYRFSPIVGQRLYLDTEGQGRNQWTLYGPGGQIYHSDLIGQDYEFEVTVGGEYLLVMSNADSTHHTYQFQLAASDTISRSLILETVIEGEIVRKGEQDVYTFEGTAGKGLFLETLKGHSNLRVRVFAPSQALAFDSSTQPTQAVFNLLESGTYRLVIGGSSNSTGSYQFRLSDEAKAPSLPFNQAVSGQLAAGVVANLYRFTGHAGQQLSFDLAAPSWNDQAQWELRGNNNQIVASSPTSRSADFKAMLPANGDYTLIIRSISSNPVDYTFTVTDTTPAAVQNSGIAGVQTGTVVIGQPIRRTFTATAGTRLLFDRQDIAQQWLTIRVFGPDGSVVYTTTTYSDFEIPQLQQSGNYTLVIEAVYGATNYQYELIELLNDVPAPFRGRRTLAFNAEVVKPIPARAVHEYTFAGEAGQRLLFDGMLADPAIGGSGAVSVSLLSPSREEVFSLGYFQGFATGDVAPFTLTESGAYTLLLSNQENREAGYRFRLWDLAEVPDLVLNKPVRDNLLRGSDTNLYKFAGKAGQSIYVGGLSGDRSRWSLYRPGSRDPIAGGVNWLKPSDDIVLPVDGDYVFAISGFSDSPSQYGFQVFSSTTVSRQLHWLI
ncbi:hypothetical protein IQ250_18425 [Pseudanabaenaceae cyanobacterium LEGE 13415]|nr:hypothetical protein [Pseudanabaenaceae cyanobacterium LEGE 13415]